MVTVSIVSLIYRSRKYADWVYESVHEFTPSLKKGVAEFFFVANDATDDLLAHLEHKGYPHVVNSNPRRTEDDLFKLGYGTPEYMHRVYRGYNKGITSAAGEVVVLVNSDNYFSPDWLENLLKYLSSRTIVCSKLVEPFNAKYGGVFPGAYRCEFGLNPDDFDKEAFLAFGEKVRATGLQLRGAYMPCAFYKRSAVKVGLYPEGNIAGKSFSHVVRYGDEAFFQRLGRIGVKQVTAMDSIVYHTKEGEAADITQPREKVKSNASLRGPYRELEWPPAESVLPVMVRRDGETQYLDIPGATARIGTLKELTSRGVISVREGCLKVAVAVVGKLPKGLGNRIRAVWHFVNRGGA